MSLSEVRKRVEEFRSKYDPHLSEQKVPLDLVTFVDLVLKMDLIPYDGLYDTFSAEAAVLSDFSGFYIDSKTFDQLDTKLEWKLNRLRFSLAHELGHWVLHQTEFKEQGIASAEHLREWLNNHGGRKDHIEREANEFAGRLLVPMESLTEQFENFAQALDRLKGRHGWIRDENLRKQTSETISQKFGVNSQVIEVRLHRELLWPSIYS